MLQADDVVNQSRHGGPRGLGIAMRQRHGDFFVTALDQFRHGIAAIIHDRVVETAKTGAWIACRIDDTTGLEHIDDEDGFLDALQFHLAVGGKVLINVPACQWLYSDYDRAAGHVRRYCIDSLHHVANRNRLIVGRHTYWGLPFIPLLILRRLWILEGTREEIIATGMSDRGALMNHLLVLLSGCEWIPQRLLGTSLMAVLEKPASRPG